MTAAIKIFNLFLVFLFICLPDRNQQINYHFSQEGDCYTFKSTFSVKAEADCLLNIVYDFNNVAIYSSSADSVILKQSGHDWYDLAFVYRKFLVFKNTSTWRRSKLKDDSKIVFNLLYSKNNLKFLPGLISSSGYYYFKQQDDSCIVEFYQNGCLKHGFLQDRYIHEAKKEAIKFIHDFKSFIIRQSGSDSVKE